MCHNKVAILTLRLCVTSLTLIFNNNGFFFLVTQVIDIAEVTHLMTHDAMDWHFLLPCLYKDDLIIQAHFS